MTKSLKKCCSVSVNWESHGNLFLTFLTFNIMSMLTHLSCFGNPGSKSPREECVVMIIEMSV